MPLELVDAIRSVTDDETVHAVLRTEPLTLREIAQRLDALGSSWPSVRAMLRLTLYRLQEAGRATPDKTGRTGQVPQRWCST